MSYGNKLLSIDQLLAAWQNRNQMENNSTQTAMQQKLAQQQIEAQDLANKKSELELSLLTSPFNIPRESWAGSGNANTPGTDKAISDNLKMQKLSMLTGKNMPNQGISGYGGYGGRGGGERDDGQPAATGGMSYYGPDHSVAPNTVEAATALGNIMSAGVPKQEPTIADLLADEQANVAGMESLANQAGNRGINLTGAGLSGGMNPVTQAVSDANATKKTESNSFLAGGPMPKNLTPEEELNLRNQKNKMESGSKAKESKDKKISETWNKLYSEPEWLVVKDDPVLLKELESKLPGLVEYANKRKRPLDPKLIFANLIRDGKL